jgi:uncharacterized protein (DUF433 family)
VNEQGTDTGIAVGTRVRKRSDLSGWFITSVGTVEGITSDRGNQVLVHWDGHLEPDWELVGWLEPVKELAPPDPPRAPERILAPGIVQSDGTCDGKPRLAGTRMPTDTARSWPDYETYLRAYPHIRQEQYERAACFEAGVRWAKERRKAKKAKGGKGG